MDWFSRKVLRWQLSNTMDASLWIDALEVALQRAPPEDVITDQRSQCACDSFTRRLPEREIAISMDGRDGRSRPRESR